MRGVQGESGNYYFMLLLEFCTLFLPMLKQTYMFLRSRNPFFKVLKKFNLSFFQKHLFYPRLSREGAFVAVRETLSIFLCFVNVEWKIDHSEVHSENLSTLNLFIWPWQPHEYNTKLYHRFTQGSMNFCSYTFQWRTFWLQINWCHDLTKKNKVLKFSE